MREQSECVAQARNSRKKDPPLGHSGWQVVATMNDGTPVPDEGTTILAWVVKANGEGRATEVRRTSPLFEGKYDFEGRECFFADARANWHLMASPREFASPSPPAAKAALSDATLRARIRELEAEVRSLKGEDDDDEPF